MRVKPAGVHVPMVTRRGEGLHAESRIPYTAWMHKHVEPDPHAPMVSCPKCGTKMERHVNGPLQVDRCPTCSGLWLDALELGRILETPGEVARLDKGRGERGSQRDSVRRINCPRDGSPLIAMSDPRQPHVRFEQCSVCGGLFLDAGELKDLSEFTLRERLRAVFG